MNILHWIPQKPEKFLSPLPLPLTYTLQHNTVSNCRSLKTANNAVVICIWNDTHNKTVCYIQHICKKLNFHNGMKSTVTLSNTHPCCMLFLSCMKHNRTCIYIYKIKAVTTKHCSLCHTYRRNCSPTTKMKRTATQDGWPMTNSHCKTVPQLCPTWTSKVSTKWSSHFVIGRSHSTGNHVTCDSADTCCHWQEIPASQSSCSYNRSHVDVTFLLPTPSHFQGGCIQLTTPWKTYVAMRNPVMQSRIIYHWMGLIRSIKIGSVQMFIHR